MNERDPRKPVKETDHSPQSNEHKHNNSDISELSIEPNPLSPHYLLTKAELKELFSKLIEYYGDEPRQYLKEETSNNKEIKSYWQQPGHIYRRLPYTDVPFNASFLQIIPLGDYRNNHKKLGGFDRFFLQIGGGNINQIIQENYQIHPMENNIFAYEFTSEVDLDRLWHILKKRKLVQTQVPDLKHNHATIFKDKTHFKSRMIQQSENTTSPRRPNELVFWGTIADVDNISLLLYPNLDNVRIQARYANLKPYDDVNRLPFPNKQQAEKVRGYLEKFRDELLTEDRSD